MDELWYYSLKFDNCIYRYTKQTFEDFFCKIMKADNDDFRRVKPQGKLGDYGCDGYIPSTRTFYMCYSPETMNTDSVNQNGKNKITHDLERIVQQWPDVEHLRYVLNDKYSGIGPELNQLIDSLIEKYKKYDLNLFSMESLKEIFLRLPTDKKEEIVGYCPDLSKMDPLAETFSYDAISKIIEYLDKNTAAYYKEDLLIVPDLSEKITFNKLSDRAAEILNRQKIYIPYVEEFFCKNQEYDKDKLKNQLSRLYSEACATIPEGDKTFADSRFFYLFDCICFNKKSWTIVDNTFVIIALFFESCDIFEAPIHA